MVEKNDEHADTIVCQACLNHMWVPHTIMIAIVAWYRDVDDVGCNTNQNPAAGHTKSDVAAGHLLYILFCSSHPQY